MNRKESIYFVIGLAVTAFLLTIALNETSVWVSMAGISVIPTPTWTFTPPPIGPPTSTPTYTPIPPTFTPTSTPTPVPPTFTPTYTPISSTSTPTPVPPTPTPVSLPPIVTAGQPSVVIDEGGMVVNIGSVVDPEGQEVVSLEASVGSITLDGDAWSWTYRPLDGPDDGQVVTIYAIDESGTIGIGMFELGVNNVPPGVESISDEPVVAQVGWLLLATVDFIDPSPIDIHTGVIQWGDGASCNTSAGPDSGCSVDQGTGISGSVAATHTYTAPGLYTVRLTVTDDDGASDTSSFEVMVVYDPKTSSVTGDGWIASPAGAYASDPSLTGQVDFDFVAKYKKGATVPKGNTDLQFEVAGLHFHSTSYDWLVITGSNYAQLQGRGKVNSDLAPDGEPYRFMLWAGDGTGSGGADTLRIKIWWGAAELVYDNGVDQEISDGSIDVHAKK